MDMADAVAEFTLSVYRGGDGAMRGAPCDDEKVAVGIAGWQDVRNVLRDGFGFCGAHPNHFFVVKRFVVDVAGDFLFFEAADTVLEAGSPGDGPRARESIRIAAIGLEVAWVG